MTLALLFPGQGTQHPAMLGWVDGGVDDCPEAAATLALLAAQLGADWRSRLADTEWATANAVAQALLTGLGIAAWQSIATRVPAPVAVAGYSVGELPAFCAAGVFDAATAMRLAPQRATAMQRSVAGLATGLLAITGLGAAAIAVLCRRHGLALAITLAADRQVLGGPVAALDAAQAELATQGARSTRLAIGLASHTPWMAQAAAEFAQVLEATPFAAPRSALVCNFSGAATRSAVALKAALAGQLAQPVPWPQCLDAVAERQPRCVLELGPGSALSALWNERYPQVPARSADEFRSAAAVAAWVEGVLARR